MRKLLGPPSLCVANADAVAQALAWFETGMDFADALHVALAAQADGFATFDARLARRAGRITSREGFAI